jgi:hypothetical protein
MTTPDSMSLKDIVSLIGGVLGAVAFFWRVWDVITSHIRLELEVKRDGTSDRGVVTALLTAENQGLTPKRIDYAALLIGPLELPLTSLASNIATLIDAPPSPDGRPRAMRRIYLARRLEPVFDRGKQYGIVPLPFLFADQMQIGNEKLRQRIVLDTSQLRRDQHYGIYFVMIARHSFGILRWRTTHDALLAKE